MTPAKTFDELKANVNEVGNFVEVEGDLYFDAIGAVPPNFLYVKSGILWQMGECYSKDLFYTFGEKMGKFWGCLCNKNFALNNF